MFFDYWYFSDTLTDYDIKSLSYSEIIFSIFLEPLIILFSFLGLLKDFTVDYYNLSTISFYYINILILILFSFYIFKFFSFVISNQNDYQNTHNKT